MTDPIVKEITVPLEPDRAFRLFTEEMADWWPLDQHSLSAAEDGQPARDVAVPKEVGAQVIETKPDGSKRPWGRVTTYDPGQRFGMTWHVGRPEDQASHVEVSFVTIADGTRVRLVHDDWHALGETASAVRKGYVTGWDVVFVARFGAAARQVLVAALG